MRGLGDQLLRKMNTDPKEKMRTLGTFHSKAWGSDTVFQRVVQRVARLTMIPAHGDENIMCTAGRSSLTKPVKQCSPS